MVIFQIIGSICILPPECNDNRDDLIKGILTFDTIKTGMFLDSPWERTTDYDGIYAQAYALWKQGFRYWFDDEENAELERHNRQFEEPNIEEELILTYLRQPYGEEAGEFLTATRIIELVGMYVKCPLSPKRVAFAMRRLGFEQRRTKSARGWNAVILTGDDIKNNQRQNARLSDVQ